MSPADFIKIISKGLETGDLRPLNGIRKHTELVNFVYAINSLHFDSKTLPFAVSFNDRRVDGVGIQQDDELRYSVGFLGEDCKNKVEVNSVTEVRSVLIGYLLSCRALVR